MRINVMLLMTLASRLATADATTAAGPSAAGVRGDVLKALAAWTDAQNRADSAAYLALYDAKHFKGIKRTARGGKKTYDFAGWSADRTHMLQNKPKVQVDAPSVQTWLDGKSKLKPGVSMVRFTQRYKSERYADHGSKVLHFWRDDAGRQWIVYEDLLNSQPGWDEKAEGVAKLVLTPPRSDEEALAVWRKIAPTGATYVDKLSAIPADPRVTRPLARALLAGGNFECKDVVSVSECGDESLSWADLDPKSDFEQPCLRRRLAIWALDSGGLLEADVGKLADALTTILALPAPESELPDKVLALADSMSAPLRVSLLAAAVPDVASKHLDGLPDASLAELYRTKHLDEAILPLQPAKHRELVLEALGDEQLTVDTRRKLFERVSKLKGKDVDAALASVADGDADCALAMDAAIALEARGDAKHLPKRGSSMDVDALGRALCLLVHDPNATRQLARYKEFLPPRDEVTVSEQYDNDFAERDAAGNKIDESPPNTHFTRKKATFNLDEDFGKTLPACSGGKCEVPTSNGTYAVIFTAGADGKLYISEIYRYRWSGCPC